MTDRLTELLKDTPEEAAYDETGRQAIIWGNLLKAEIRPLVAALREENARLRDVLGRAGALMSEMHPGEHSVLNCRCGADFHQTAEEVWAALTGEDKG